MATAEATREPLRTTYSPVPLSGLAAKDPVPFPLYLCTADNTWVLYRPAEAALDDSHLGRLQAEGIVQLFIRDVDRGAYFGRVERSLDQVLLQREVPLERRADVLLGVSVRVAEDLLANTPDRATLGRAQKVMMATSGLMLRETQGFQAIRRIMSSSHNLATHSLTVGFLSMGLARLVLGSDGNLLASAGLAGMLHDVGRCGHEHLDHDPDHTLRGADMLRGLGVPAAIVEAVRLHHERWDGSGFPLGLRGTQIPELAQVVGLANTFDKVYSAQRPRVGVFDALRILAQAYRGCFDERLTMSFVKLFR